MTNISDYNTWMTTLPSNLTQMPLMSLAIPGSHNSFSASLDPSEGVAVDQTACMKKVGSCCCLGPSLIQRWSQTQALSFRQQLELGVRYFHLRVCNKPGTSDLFFLHGHFGEDVLSQMREINAFLDQNPKEFIILDFNHFYAMNQHHHHKLLEGIRDIFQERFLERQNPIAQSFSSLTLENIWTTPARVMVVYHADDSVGGNTHVWYQQTVHAPWPNTESPETLIRFLESRYTERNANDQFRILQGVLTPTGKTIFLHLAGSLRESLVPHANRAVVNFLKNKRPGEQGINICIADFVETFQFVPSVIDLNFKLIS